MARAWTTLDRVASSGGTLELRRRGEREFLITVAGRVLMTSAAHRSESALAEWVCGDLSKRAPRVLIGGLGMGYTLRAALDALPPGASVSVAELEPAVVAWCRGPLAPLTGAAVGDPRVEVILADVMEPVRAAARGGRRPFDAIALDLFHGPRGTRDEEHHPLWGQGALAAVRDSLVPGGVLGIWSEAPAPGFARRLARVGFRAETRRAGRGGRRHTLYRARRALQAGGRAGRSVGGDGAFDSGHRRR
jgi:spermidine synthase